MACFFDMGMVQCGARLRRTPFFAATQRAGARGYTVYNHMGRVPGWQGRGPVTSAVHSPRLEKNIGYAIVAIESASAGTRFTVAIPAAGDREATVVPIPFVDPQKEIPKS